MRLLSALPQTVLVMALTCASFAACASNSNPLPSSLAALAAVEGTALATTAAPLFESHEPLEVTIEAPLQDVRDGRDDGEYYDGHFRLSAEQAFDLKLQARGRYRRDRETCDFPPIRLNFRKGQVKGTLLDGQDKLKLVTHCRTRSPRYEAQVIREYLAYRLLNTLTDQSFRVRLLRINWIDTATPEEPLQRWGFLIEDDDALGARFGLERAEIAGIHSKELEPELAALVGLYQYLIGNTDFSVIKGPADDICCHNSVLFKRGEQYLAVPYDFDFSGLVDAPYASPNPRLKIRDVKTRLYRGRCRHNDLIEPTYAMFVAKRDEMLALVETVPGLADYQRKGVRRYIERFFKQLEEPKDREKRLVSKCV